MASKKDSTQQDGTSLARKLEIQLLEVGGDGMTEEKTAVVFDMFEKLLPGLGVYSHILKIIKDHLHDAVYSDQYSVKPGSEPENLVKQVTYYTLVRQLFRERDAQYDQLSQQLDIVKEKLFDKQKEYEESQSKVVELEEHIVELKSSIVSLNEQVISANDRIFELEKELDEEKEKHVNTERILQGDIKDLKEDLLEKTDDIKHLTHFKEGYDLLHNAFVTEPSMESSAKPNKRKKVAVEATKKAQLISALEEAKKIEHQLLFVMNSQLEDFDRFMEGHKEELAGKVLPEDDGNYDVEQIQELEIDQADQQLLQMQQRFTQSIKSINSELELLATHVTMLQEQLQEEIQLQQSKRQTRRTNTSDSEQRPTVSAENSTLKSLEDEEETSNAREGDPFIPQERVFSKYGAMMYSSSNGGHTWHEFKTAKFCPSCGEKTVFCPHKIGLDELVVMVPIDTTHVKISRPVVRINQSLVDEAMKQAGADAGRSAVTSGDSRWRQDSSSMAALKSRGGEYSLMTPSTPQTGKDTPSLVGDASMMRCINRIWDDYKIRSGLNRSIPRQLPIDRTLSLYQQFLAFLVWNDEMAEYQDPSQPQSIVDKLYVMLGQRYLVVNVSYLASHDLIASIIEHSSVCKLFQVWTQVLAGNLSGAVLRYVSQLADFILSVDWAGVHDFREFMAVLYPFLQEDDLDNLLMGYTSFSSNKISAQLVWDYIMYTILKQREPRFQELEARLVPAAATVEGQLTEHEFTDVLENIIPTYSEHLRKVLFEETRAQALLEGFSDAVPISKLAQVTAHLQLTQMVEHIRSVLAKRIQSARNKYLTEQGTTTKLQFESQVVPNQVPLMTLAEAKQLAINISSTQASYDIFLPQERRDQARQTRDEEPNLYDV